MDQSIRLRDPLSHHAMRQRHHARGMIAFIKRQGRESHGFPAGTAAIADFHAGYDQAETNHRTAQHSHIAERQAVA